MPNTPHGSQLDPTSRDVERLLARLSGLGAAPVREPAAARAGGGGGASSSYAASQPRIAVGVARPTGLPSREEHVALWARVLLGGALALVVALLAALFTLEREDGRIEREVVEDTGCAPEGIGDPADPAHYLEER